MQPKQCKKKEKKDKKADKREDDDRPYALLPPIRQCAKCFKHGCGFQACGNCGTTRYCSRSCQKADWQHHKQHCNKCCVMVLPTRPNLPEFLHNEETMMQKIATPWHQEVWSEDIPVISCKVANKDVPTMNTALHKYNLCLVKGQLTLAQGGKYTRFVPQFCNEDIVMYTIEASTEYSSEKARKNKVKKAMVL